MAGRDKVNQTSDDIVTGVDEVDGYLTFRRKDGSEVRARRDVYGFLTINSYYPPTVWTPLTTLEVRCPPPNADILPELSNTGFNSVGAGGAFSVFGRFAGTVEDWGGYQLYFELGVSNVAATERRYATCDVPCADLVGGSSEYLPLESIAGQQAGSDLVVVGTTPPSDPKRIRSTAGGIFMVSMRAYLYIPE